MSLDMATVTFDCTDPDALAAWWADVLGSEVNAVVPGEFVLVTRQGGTAVGFQRVPDPTPGKNKAHLDLHADDMEAEVARVVALGAREVERNGFGDDFRWVVLADPEGNAFCIAGG
ncbi:VOC family protein [Mycobacterium hodleri]|uniref:VOC family protein n=1 Tax=Mycolicibacterium hodleri TaxID=49897 RepID=UPI0021F3C5D7|nr:VOC family protein [Mycolicibacterium hodleri]MCV7134852.1 VOC family protein [Mycolicibacterium hodleri]